MKFRSQLMVCLVLCSASLVIAQQDQQTSTTAETVGTTAPQMAAFPKPQKEHEWLHQFRGEWVSSGTLIMDPAQPPVVTSGTETGKMLGDFWLMTEHRGEFMGNPFVGIMTLGFDPEKKKYVGNWIDVMTPHLWQYEGTVDESGKKLTLEAEGPCPMQPGKHVKFRETVEFKDNDTKLFTSQMEMDGKWIPIMSMESKRKQ